MTEIKIGDVLARGCCPLCQQLQHVERTLDRHLTLRAGKLCESLHCPACMATFIPPSSTAAERVDFGQSALA